METVVLFCFLVPVFILGLACLGSLFLLKRNYARSLNPLRAVLPFALLAGVGATLVSLRYGKYLPGEAFGSGPGIASGYPLLWMNTGITGLFSAPFTVSVDLLFWFLISFLILILVHWVIVKIPSTRFQLVLLATTTFLLMFMPLVISYLDPNVKAVDDIQSRVNEQDEERQSMYDDGIRCAALNTHTHSYTNPLI